VPRLLLPFAFLISTTIIIHFIAPGGAVIYHEFNPIIQSIKFQKLPGLQQCSNKIDIKSATFSGNQRIPRTFAFWKLIQIFLLRAFRA
jgi:hypothetical protein